MPGHAGTCTCGMLSAYLLTDYAYPRARSVSNKDTRIILHIVCYAKHTKLVQLFEPCTGSIYGNTDEYYC